MALAENSEHWKLPQASLGLLPEAEGPYYEPIPADLQRQLGRKLTDDEQALLKMDETGKWKEYADDVISFQIPDHPLFKVEMLEPGDQPRLSFVGGRVGNTDTSFHRVYRMTFSDGAPYGLIFVTDAEWFDEGICFCGPIHMLSFVHAQGNLIEMSLLPGGQVKKFQVLNGSLRAILFEWTHSVITQEAYVRIGASIRLKPASERSREEWMALSKEKRGFRGGLGWLKPGMPKENVLAVLGDPFRQEPGRLLYRIEEKNWEGRRQVWTFALPLENGKLRQLEANWTTVENLPEPRGSDLWLQDTLSEWRNLTDDLDEGQFPNLPQEDVAFILGMFHDQAPNAVGDAYGAWAWVLESLAAVGVKDPKAVALIAERSRDMTLPHFSTRWVLDQYDHPELIPFVQRRLTHLMNLEGKDEVNATEVQNLYSSLVHDTELPKDLMIRGLEHPNERIRNGAAYFLDELPRDAAREHLKRLIRDPNRNVRFAAQLHIRKLCTESDRDWLQVALDTEPDSSNRHYIQEKLDRLPPDRDEPGKSP